MCAHEGLLSGVLGCLRVAQRVAADGEHHGCELVEERSDLSARVVAQPCIPPGDDAHRLTRIDVRMLPLGVLRATDAPGSPDAAAYFGNVIGLRRVSARAILRRKRHKTEVKAMLESARIAAIVPVSDIERAVEFYEGALGLSLDVRRDDLPSNREAEFTGPAGSLVLYESVGAGQSRHTIAAFRVDSLDAVVPALRERGVVFEEYDLPDLKTENGIASVGDVRAAWFKDPDGNILALESVPG